MAGHFTITLEPSTSLIVITMSGFFGEDEVAAFGHEIAQAVASLPCPASEHKKLCDISEMAIQSQGTFAAFQTLLANAAIQARLLAFVTIRTLARFQARRLNDRPGIAFFEDERSARAWLSA